MPEIRIIGGRWRGRKITFPDHIGLRPTPNRVRETLFNWLTLSILDTSCLDTFAGSGALGFEAFSRGAKQVTFLEKSAHVAEEIKKNVARLNREKEESHLYIYCTDALQYLTETSERFNIIFLDPPFQSNLLLSCLEIIVSRDLLLPQGYIYMEDKASIPPAISPYISCIHSKRAGNVYYALFRNCN